MQGNKQASVKITVNFLRTNKDLALELPYGRENKYREAEAMAFNNNKQNYSVADRATSTQHEEFITDKELAARCATSDMASFDELYRRHYRRVFCICLKMTHNVADAEDITQDVFIQLQRNAGS